MANQQFLTAQDIIRFTTNMITSTAPQHYSAALTCCLSPTITGGTSGTSTRPNLNLTRPPTDTPSSSDKPQAITVSKVPLPSSSSSYTSSSADQEHLKVRIYTLSYLPFSSFYTYTYLHTTYTHPTSYLSSLLQRKSAFPTYDKYKAKTEKELGLGQGDVDLSDQSYTIQGLDGTGGGVGGGGVGGAHLGADVDTVMESLATYAGKAIFPLPSGMYMLRVCIYYKMFNTVLCLYISLSVTSICVFSRMFYMCIKC